MLKTLKPAPIKLRAIAAALAVALMASACANSGGHTVQEAPESSASRYVPVAPVGAGNLETRQLLSLPYERNYLLYRPPGRSEALPTLLVFHGSGSNAELSRYYGLEREADRQGFNIAYMNGWAGVWNSGFDIPRTEHGGEFIDDLAYFDAAVADLLGAGVARREAIFVAGASNGGLMSITLACRRAQVIRGAVVAIAVMSRGQAEGCEGVELPSALLMLGAEDPIVPHDGRNLPGPDSMAVLSFDETLAKFARGAGCQRRDGPDSEGRVVWHDCAGAKIVEGYLTPGLGHRWPGTNFQEALASSLGVELPAPIEQIIGPATDRLDGSAAVAEFMQRVLAQGQRQ